MVLFNARLFGFIRVILRIFNLNINGCFNCGSKVIFQLLPDSAFGNQRNI